MSYPTYLLSSDIYIPLDIAYRAYKRRYIKEFETFGAYIDDLKHHGILIY